MIRIVVSLALLGAVANAASAQVNERERPGAPGNVRSRGFGDASISSELDIPYADADNPRQRLDLYLPKNPASDKLPVIAFVHGGGWQSGDKSRGRGRVAPFVQSGNYAGASIGYRLTDEASWPAQIHDCKAAIRWIRANADQYGLDADRIGVWGTSAGGHLVLMLGLSGDAPELAGDFGPYDDVSSRVTCVANFFGPTDFSAMLDRPSAIDHARPNSPEAKLIGGPVRENPEKAKAASPIAYVSPDDPPVLTVHGDGDRIVSYDQAVRLDAALDQAGVPSYFITVEAAGHGDFGRAADERVRAFFAKYLLGKEANVSQATITNWR